MNGNLVKALRLGPTPQLALVGSGGKTTALFQIARQLKPPVILTTTTHLAVEQIHWGDRHIMISQMDDLQTFTDRLPPEVIVVTGQQVSGGRIVGLGQHLIRQLANMCAGKLPLLIEADGARLRPLKAPGEHEPALPDFVSEVIVSAGLSALGKPLTAEWVHRPEYFARLTGLQEGELITPQSLKQALLHPNGGLKGIPERARPICILNQADTPELQSFAGEMAASLLGAYQSVLVTSLSPGGLAGTSSNFATPPMASRAVIYAVHEPVAGIVLAAGASRRLGQPKQLLDWKGKPLLRHIAEIALRSGLDPVIVVCGAAAAEIAPTLEGLAVQVVRNEAWQSGQSTSIRAGVNALPQAAGAAVFFLSDQPNIPPALVRALVETHQREMADIVAPLIDGQRGNPALFDRRLFDDLTRLQGDVGGRELFSRYPVSWVPWLDRRPLADIDTLADYERLLAEEKD